MKNKANGRQLKTPLIYYGGKSLLANEIINVIPPHSMWIETFGGGAAVTIAKGASEKEIYNDPGNVSRFFRVLRDRGPELYQKLLLSPWSRDEFELCMASSPTGWPYESNEVEWARKWFIAISQGFDHTEACKSWLINKGGNPAKSFANRVDTLSYVSDRFRDIVIENRHFRELIRLYDNKNALFYHDPPYMAESRSDMSTGYSNEMSEKEHEELLWMSTKCDAQVIISGYSHPLYDQYLNNSDWRCIKITRTSRIHNSNAKMDREKVECIWLKVHNAGLWSEAEGSQKVGRNVSEIHSKTDREPDFKQESLFS
jgi:DNA adenine methylase